MTVAVWLLGIAVAVLAVLVLGLLRSHAMILRRLHEAGIDLAEAGTSPVPASQAVPSESASGDPVTPRPGSAPTGRAAHDIAGTTPDGGVVALAVRETTHDTVLLFLSADCGTCQNFWDVLAPAAPDAPSLPPDTRLVVVTRGPQHESPSAVAAHRTGVPVVMSDDAWQTYAVPGSPYVVHVDGASGRVSGEGTGATWPQVADLLARATGDVAWLEATPRQRKYRRDATAERDTDAALLSAGIRPGDESLYRRADGTWSGPGEDPR